MFIDKEQLVTLSMIPGIGPTRIRALVAHFKATDMIFKASIKELCAVEGIDTKTARNIRDFSDLDAGKKQADSAARAGVNIIHFWDENYPELLKKIYDPPAYLFVKGKLCREDKFSLSIVGTRLPSSYGRLVAEKFATELAQKGLTVVSGLARGIDTVSHWAAIRAGGRTLAVMGSGLDRIYPAENEKLADKIAQHGALISEFPMGTEPDAMNFPRRNRIISGITMGTIVVEAGIKSGALLTANYAVEQNREVFAVPGNINSPKSAGTNQLIKNGAKLTSSVSDILNELEPQLKRYLEGERGARSDELENLTVLEKQIINCLSHEPIHIDKLAGMIQKSTAETLSLLLPLEFKDLVKQLPGKLFVRV